MEKALRLLLQLLRLQQQMRLRLGIVRDGLWKGRRMEDEWGQLLLWLSWFGSGLEDRRVGDGGQRREEGVGGRLKRMLLRDTDKEGGDDGEVGDVGEDDGCHD